MDGAELVVSEVWNNHFHWKPVNIRGDHEYKSLKVLNQMKSFYTYIYALRNVNKHFMVADLLKADYSSANYTRLHANIVVNTQIDRAAFQELDAMLGLSIMNVYDEGFIKLASRIRGKRKKKGGLEDDINAFVETKISFNMGGSYSDIRAPAMDSTNKPYPPCHDCSLHLHTHDNTMFPQIYTQKSAPGIIIGNGNVGEHLSYDQKNIATFISTDGGLNFREVLKGSHVYEMGD